MDWAGSKRWHCAASLALRNPSRGMPRTSPHAMSVQPPLSAVTLPVSEGHHLHSQFTGGCTAAAFARRGTLVVTGGQDGTVLVSVLHGIQVTMRGGRHRAGGVSVCDSLYAFTPALSPHPSHRVPPVTASQSPPVTDPFSH